MLAVKDTNQTAHYNHQTFTSYKILRKQAVTYLLNIDGEVVLQMSEISSS